MKFFYLFVGALCIIAIAILYFQLIIASAASMPFFSTYIEMKVFAFYLMLLSILAGVMITLGIKGFLDSSSKIDDDFDL